MPKRLKVKRDEAEERQRKYDQIDRDADGFRDPEFGLRQAVKAGLQDPREVKYPEQSTSLQNWLSGAGLARYLQARRDDIVAISREIKKQKKGKKKKK